MYFVNIEVSLPSHCYFCGKNLAGIENFALLEGHAFCPNCGYEVMGSEVEVQTDKLTEDSYDEFYYKRARGFTAQQNC